MIGARSLAAGAVVLGLTSGCAQPSGDVGADGPETASPGSSGQATGDAVAASPPGAVGGTAASRALPLAGKVVVLDPGHQLGNRHHPAQINRLVNAGGLRKPCNTTGTATRGGYPEATFAWRVALAARDRLQRLGARVVLTRTRNSARRWGPCVDARGRAGNPGRPGPTADVKVSIHGDGSLAAGAHGFHVIRPGVRRGWTDDVARPSRRLAGAVRDALVHAGLTRSTYRGHNGVDVRNDLGTLNWSDVPVVMAELGNMRDARDGARMRSARGQARYARALVRGIRAFLEGRG